jgi:hypothetical protein
MESDSDGGDVFCDARDDSDSDGEDGMNDYNADSHCVVEATAPLNLRDQTSSIETGLGVVK